MPFSTTTELAEFVEKELGHDVSGASSQRTDVVSHLDRAHKIVLAGGGFLNYDESGRRQSDEINFSFARSQNPKILNLIAAIEPDDITANVTNNSTTVTFSADPNSGTSIEGYHIRFGNDQEVYRISAHTAATTTATLDAAYVNDTATEVGIKVFKLQYTVGSGDILKLIGPIRSYGDNFEISLFDRDELLENWPLSDVSKAFPSAACLLLESSGTLTLQFNSYPEDMERVELDYVPIPSTLDTTSVNPIIPAQFRLVLAHMACYSLLLRNEDTRATEHLRTARMLFQELAAWNNSLYTTGDAKIGKILSKGTSVTFSNPFRVKWQ